MFDYEYQRVSYFSESSRNSDRHYITLNAYKKWGDRWHLSLSDSFVRSEDPIVLQDSIGVIRYEKIKYDYNLADLYLRYSLGGDSYWRFSYHDLLFKNRASGVENTASHNPYFDIVYWFSFPLGFHFQSGVNLGEFDYSPDFSEYNNSISLMYRPSLEGLLTIKMSVSNMYFSGGASDYDIYDFSCGYSYAFSDNLNVSFGVGYFYQDLDRGHDEEGPSGFLFVKWQKEAFSLSIENSMGYDEIYFDGEDLGFSKYSLSGLVGNYYLPKYGSFYLRCSYRQDKFPEAYYQEIKEYTTILAFGFNRKIGKYLNFSIDYMHWNRAANVDDYEYRDNRLTFTLKASKDFIW